MGQYLGLYRVGGLKMTIEIKLLSVVCSLLILFSFCACSSQEKIVIESLRVEHGTGQCFVQTDENDHSRYYVRMSVKVDDRSMIATEISKVLFESLRKSEPIMTDVELKYVELIRLKWSYSDGKSGVLFVVYDYVTQKEYVIHEDNLYLLQNDSLKTIFIKPYLMNKYGDNWEQRLSNAEKNEFRYYQHWTSDRPRGIEKYQTSNFVCQTPLEITDERGVIQRAMEETCVMNPTDIDWYYDITTGYWMVRLFDENNGHIGENEEAIYAHYVVMDSQGMIVEKYIFNVLINKM